MLPVSIVLAMVFRNVRPRPTQQKLIKDLLVYDVDDTHADVVREYEQRRAQMDDNDGSFKSLSLGSLPTHQQQQQQTHDQQQASLVWFE